MGKKKEEAELNTGMQNYYFTTSIVFGLLSLYCFLYYLNYASLTCIKNDTSEVAIEKAKQKAANEAASQKEQAELAAKFGGGAAAAPAAPAAGAGLLRRILMMQMEDIRHKNKKERQLKELQEWEDQVIANGTFSDKIQVYKKKIKRGFNNLAEKFKNNRRALGHLSPKDQAALGALSARMTKDAEDPEDVYNLDEGTSQTINAFGMFIAYAIQSLLSFQVASGMACFARYLPTEIPNLNCCVRCYGGCVRKLMDLQVKLHYVTLVQVILLWLGSLQNSCVLAGNFAVLADGGALAVSADAGNDAAMMLQVCGMMWFFLHYIGGIIRSVIYIEPLYQIPDDPDENPVKVVLFQRLGP